jgi:hypothetical protein
MSQEHYYAVALVVDRAFGDQLLELVRRLHVWIVDSPGNRAAVKEAWSELVPRYSLDEGATIFDDDGTRAPDEVAAARLDNIELHHGGFSHSPPLTRLEVCGTRRTALLSSTLEARGFSLVDEFPGGFILERHLEDAG